MTWSKWVFVLYLRLWKKHEKRMFSFEDAATLLKKDERSLSVAFSDMKKVKWLTSHPHPENARKRMYKLADIETVLNDIVTSS